jgi:hypothetical protein
MRTVVIALAMLLGCGDDTQMSGSCRFGAPQPACFEYTDASADELDRDAMPMCRDNQGTWADAACARAGIIAGCRAEITGAYGRYTQTIWFYPGGTVTTAADVEARCPGLGGELVVP